MIILAAIHLTFAAAHIAFALWLLGPERDDTAEHVDRELRSRTMGKTL